ncbi:MAG: hypothetical protein IIB54_10755 [Planctomycetes bacterium]|nr:hypothetical protein [Planctomycetota bacterium]
MSPTMHPGLRPRTRLALVLLLLSPLALAVPQLRGPGFADEGDNMAVVGSKRTIDDSRPILGYAIVAHHIGDLKLYLRSVDEIAAMGANALTIVTPLFQEYVDSSEIRYLPKKCPTEEQLEAIFLRAKKHGMTTILQPIILIEKPEKKDWRGVIEPDDWRAWWQSYHRLIDKFLRVANASNVDLFVVGSELNTTEDQLGEWRTIIEKVRANFPGQITYSANWDRYRKTKIWPLVDAMSVSAYFELERDQPGAELEKLVRAWGPIRDRLIDFAREQDLPLLLSEVGYPSLPWANAHPWNYVAGKKKADHALQARCYEAFFAAWADLRRPRRACGRILLLSLGSISPGSFLRHRLWREGQAGEEGNRTRVQKDSRSHREPTPPIRRDAANHRSRIVSMKSFPQDIWRAGKFPPRNRTYF